MPTEIFTPVNVAIGAALISLSTLGISIWQWARTRRSEQLKIARELMYSIHESRQVLDTFLNRFNTAPQSDDVAHNLRVLEWNRSLGDFMFEIEDFRSFVEFQGIKNKSEIVIYRSRLHGDLLYVKQLRLILTLIDQHAKEHSDNIQQADLIPLENQDAKEHYDNWITGLLNWCEQGNSVYSRDKAALEKTSKSTE